MSVRPRVGIRKHSSLNSFGLTLSFRSGQRSVLLLAEVGQVAFAAALEEQHVQEVEVAEHDVVALSCALALPLLSSLEGFPAG